VRNTPVLHRDREGRVLSHDGLIEDVTERRLAEDALRGRTAQLETVRAIGEEITRELDLQALLALIVRRATELVGARAGSILLWDDEAGFLVPSAWHGFGDWQSRERLRVGEGLVGTVAKRRIGMIVNNYRDWPDALPLTLERSSITAALAEPLLHKDRLLGVIALSDEGTGRVFAKQDQETLALLASHAVIAIENARLYAAAVRRGSELEALVSAVRSVTSGLELQEILDRILAEAGRITGAPHVKVLLLDKAAGVLRVGARQGSAMPEGYALPVGIGSSGIVARTGKPLFMSDAQHDPRSIFAEQDRDLGIVTYLGLPITRGEEVLGVLTFNTTRPHRYTADEMSYLASFADQAAIAIEKAQLFQELNQSYADLQKAQDELIRAEKLRALGQMSAGIAHDLNNMLAAILGQVELLRLRARDPEVQEGLRTLETAATDGVHVVRRLQDFARQRGRSPLTSIDLAGVVTEALEITRPRWRDEVQRQGRVIEVEVSLENLPPVLGYAPEVREVLTNLILNAVDAMPTGGKLSLAAEVMKAAESASQPSLPGVEMLSEVELQVTDTGIGMSEEVRQRVFDPFFTTKGGRGTGLGLSLVYGIMERHGGRIEVRSAPGRGASFMLRFRTAPPKDAAAPQDPTERRTMPRRLLVVDDDHMVRQAIAGLLRASGHVVTDADGGAAGIARLEETPVDLVFTDLGMPEVTGWDVARAVRARRPGLPIVLLTGWGEHGTGEAQPVGLVDRILGKPVRLEDLLAVIDELTTVEPSEGSRDATPGS
jgi:signal transduction histidine kinase/ActR/RegA family two-component response regulator